MRFCKRVNLYFPIALIFLIVCMILISLFSGFDHLPITAFSIVVNVFLIILTLMVISDGIIFVICSIDKAIWPCQMQTLKVNSNVTHHTRTDYLKLRLSTLRSQMMCTEKHRNETLNLTYKTITQDLFLYGKYFLFLMLLVIVTQSDLLYYNTHLMEEIFMKNRTLTMGVGSVREMDDIYKAIDSLFISGFSANLTNAYEYEWVYGNHTSVLGVVRLRQLRRMEDMLVGWSPAEFSKDDFNAEWKAPYHRVPYTNKYWSIYEPWLSIYPIYSDLDRLFLDFHHRGSVENYPELHGYITQLARTRNSSLKVLNYLKANHWLTWNTSAVLIDFTLYNVDVHFFTVCTLLVEQLPFGTIQSIANINSITLQLFDQLGAPGIIILAIYCLMLVEFSKQLVVTLWYEPSMMRSVWTKMDLVIFILNVTVVIVVIIREIMVSSLLKKVEGASILEFLNFRKPARLYYLTNILIGFLVCMVTLRLWRVLQFASVFQLFTNTLFTAWKALASMAMIIFFLLMGYGVAVVIINGNSSRVCTDFNRCIISVLCYAFRFSYNMKPQDLCYGGFFLGIVLYLLLAVVLANLLINVSVAIVNDYFKNAKIIRDACELNELRFLNFVRVEYAGFFKCIRRPFLRYYGYKANNRTVAENIKRMLIVQESTTKNRYKALGAGNVEVVDEVNKQDDYRQRIELSFTIAALMLTQMELLEHYLFIDDDEEWMNEGSFYEEDDDEVESDHDDYESDEDYV